MIVATLRISYKMRKKRYLTVWCKAKKENKHKEISKNTKLRDLKERKNKKNIHKTIRLLVTAIKKKMRKKIKNNLSNQ